MIEKIKVEDIKPSSRQYPFIRFDVDDKEKLHRLAVEAQGLAKGYDNAALQELQHARSRPASASRSSAQRRRQDDAAALPRPAI